MNEMNGEGILMMYSPYTNITLYIRLLMLLILVQHVVFLSIMILKVLSLLLISREKEFVR